MTKTERMNDLELQEGETHYCSERKQYVSRACLEYDRDVGLLVSTEGALEVVWPVYCIVISETDGVIVLGGGLLS